MIVAWIVLLASPAANAQSATTPCTSFGQNEIAVEANGTLFVRVFSRTGTLLHTAFVTSQPGCDWYADFGNDGTGVHLPWDVTTFEFTAEMPDGSDVTTVYTYSQGYRAGQSISFYYPSGSTATDNKIRFDTDTSTGTVRATYPANSALNLNGTLGPDFVWPYDDIAFCSAPAAGCMAPGPSPGPFLARIPSLPASWTNRTYAFSSGSSPRVQAGELWVWEEPGLTLRLSFQRQIIVAGSFVTTGATFTAAIPVQGWKGFFFRDGSTGLLSATTVTRLRGLGGNCCSPLAAAVLIDAQSAPATVVLKGVTFQGNTDAITDDAGGVYAYGSFATVTIDGASVIRDYDGDGIGASDGAQVTLTGESIVQNSGRFGGHVFNTATLLTITGGSTITQSDSAGVWADYGAAIRVDGGSFITDNLRGGLRATGAGSEVRLGVSTVEANFGAPGIEAYDGGAAVFDAAAGQGHFVTVRSNAGGLAARSSGTVYAGQCDLSDCLLMPHSIQGNAPNAFDARAVNGSTVLAQGDYWGPNRTTPTDLVLVVDKTSYLDVTPLSTVAPSFDGASAAGRPAPPAGRQTTERGGDATPDALSSGVLSAIADVHRALASGDTTAAFGFVTSALRLASSPDDWRLASATAGFLLYRAESAGLLTWLDGNAAATGSGRAWALRALAVAHGNARRHGPAQAAAAALIAGNDRNEHALFGRAWQVRLAVDARDEAGALFAFNALAAAFPDADETARASAVIAATFPEVDPGRLGVPHLAARAASQTADAPAALRVSVWPNPAATQATIAVDLDAEAVTTVTVFDALGRSVGVLLDGTLPSGTHDVSLDTASLAPGVYVVRVTARPVSGGPSAVLLRRVTVSR